MGNFVRPISNLVKEKIYKSFHFKRLLITLFL